MDPPDSGFARRLEEDRELAAALAAVRGSAGPEGPEADTTAAQQTEALARIVWSRLAEPGDAIAGILVRALGAARALAAVADDLDPVDLHALLRCTGESEIAPRAIRQGLARWGPRLDRGATLQDLARAAATGMTPIMAGDPDWPPGLDDLGDHTPMLLWMRGRTEALSRHALAVVGARACTGYGSHVTAELTDAACASGATIISGAAYGIDAVAHRTALAVGGTTIAVLAGGADRAYPAAHGDLLDRIARAGAVCSEMVPGAAPTRWRFLQRNRIIAALAAGTLVTEAGIRSGSLNTAGHAAALGRELGAVPGPVTSAASTGCHRLIRDYGATLITNGADLREFLGVRDDAEVLDPSSTVVRVEGVVGAEGTEEAARDSMSDAGREAEGAAGPGSRGGDSGSRQPALHRRLLDALPLRGIRPEGEAARRAGVSDADARAGFAELELLGMALREETPGGERGWRLMRRE